MNAQDKELKTVYTTQDEIITISLHEYGYEWHVTYTVTITDGNQSEMIDWRLLYNGFSYANALVMYKAACSAQAFLPDNKISESDRSSDDISVCTMPEITRKESGQAGLLFLIIIAAIILLYVAYTGVSQLTGSNSLFGSLLSGVGQVLR